MSEDKPGWTINWIDLVYDPVTGLTTVTGASDDELLGEYQEAFHNHEVEVPDKSRKKLPKERQKEWQ